MVKEILGYICLGGAVISFVSMYLIPRLNRQKNSTSRKINPARAKGEERLIRIEERTGLMIPLQLILIGSVLLT